MALSTLDQRREKRNLLSGKILTNALKHLVFRVAHHLFPRHIAVGISSAGIQQAKEVVNLGDGADR